MKTSSRILRGQPLAHLAAVMTLGLVSGCTTLGPDYQPPSGNDLKMPSSWSTGTALAQPETASQASEPWWSALNDKELESLVQAALASSPTREAAVARVAEARASQAQVVANGWPAANLTAADKRNKQAAGLTTDATANIGLSWELDLFGAVRRGTEGAQARTQRSQADLANAHLSLAADVADAYSSYRQCQAALELATDDLQSRQETARLTSLKEEAGFVAPYLAARAQATAAEGLTVLSATRAQCERSLNLLVRLTGLPKVELEARLRPATGIPAPRSLDVRLPQEVLHARPDLVMAERAVAASVADIGLAQANRFPRLSLTGNLGYLSSATSAGTLSLGTWSFGPSLSVPLLDGGTRKAAVQAAQARYEQALAAYKQTARIAVQEVEDALTRYAAAVERRASARAAVDNYTRSFQAMDARYREGASSLLELEDARRALLAAKQTELAVRLETTQAWIALNRATGGGWNPAAASGTAAQASTSTPNTNDGAQASASLN